MGAIPADKLQDLVNAYREEASNARVRSESGGEIGAVLWAGKAATFALVAEHLSALIADHGSDV